MAVFLIYIIRWAVVLTLLYSLYGLFLRRETFHGVNRFVLLSILIGSMLLPLCAIETDAPTALAEGNAKTEAFISSSLQTAQRVYDGSAEYGQREDLMPVHIAIWTAAAVYLAGLLFCWFRYLAAMVAVGRLIAGGVPFEGCLTLPCGVKLLSNPCVDVPCSWMKWVLVNPRDEDDDAILAHELAHVRMLHSLDMLLAETTCCMLWFLPFSWMLRQDLKDIHEYQADRSVVTQGYDRDRYELLLIDRVTKEHLQPVVNALNQSAVKKRLRMMYKRKSNRLAMLKAAYLLPLAGIAVTALAHPTIIRDVEIRLEQAEVQAYEIVTGAPAFIPEDEPIVMTSVPAPPFSLRNEVEGENKHNIYGIRCGQREMWGEYVEMCRGFNFRRVGSETYMQVFGTIDSDEETIWLGGPDTYIVNERTGIRYKARRALSPASLNRDILVKGCKGQEFMFTIVFPELPRGVWNARIYGVPYCQMRGGARVAYITQYFEL